LAAPGLAFETLAFGDVAFGFRACDVRFTARGMRATYVQPRY
jgi:hypothetical protein